MLLVLFFMLVFGLIGALIGKQKGRAQAGFWWGFFLGIFGWLIVALGPDVRPKCTECKAPVDPEATKCRHCGSDIEPTSASGEKSILGADLFNRATKLSDEERYTPWKQR